MLFIHKDKDKKRQRAVTPAPDTRMLGDEVTTHTSKKEEI